MEWFFKNGRFLGKPVFASYPGYGHVPARSAESTRVVRGRGLFGNHSHFFQQSSHSGRPDPARDVGGIFGKHRPGAGAFHAPGRIWNPVQHDRGHLFGPPAKRIFHELVRQTGGRGIRIPPACDRDCPLPWLSRRRTFFSGRGDIQEKVAILTGGDKEAGLRY